MGFLSDLAGGLVGQFLGNSVNNHSAKQNAELEAKLQRENWEYMQKNKHQFEVQDLRNAGLNPILSAGAGSAVSAPSISGDSHESNSNTFTTAKQFRLAEKELSIQEKNAEIELKKANTQEILAKSQALSLTAQAGFYNAGSALQYAQKDEISHNILLNYSRFAQDVKESDSRINLNNVTAQDIATLTPYKRNLMTQQAQEIVANLGVTARDIKLLDKQLFGLSAQYRDEYLRSWIGEILTKAGFYGQDISNLVSPVTNTVKFLIGRSKGGK